MIFFPSAKRTLEAGDKFCWVGAFSLRGHAPPTPTVLFWHQGVRCAGAKKSSSLSPRCGLRSGIFPPRPLTPKDNRPAPPRLAKDLFGKDEGWSRGERWIHGAGEGIRTLDFNLGKVALYP